MRCGVAAKGWRTLRGLPVYAVGEATAEAARNGGFDIAATGDAGVDRLLGSIEAGPESAASLRRGPARAG